MGLLDKIKDIFFGGPDNWAERLQGSVDFISPSGKEFKAKWRGSERSIDKKLGIIAYPKVAGNVVQDMDVQSTIHPIPFSFDGENNDKTADSFLTACKERGVWEITHPVYGFAELQLMSITERLDPILSGGITSFDSTWIEAIDESILMTARELADLINGSCDDLNISAAQQFANKIKQGTEKLKAGIKTAVKGVQNLSDFVLDPFKSISDSIDSSFNAIQDGINDSLNATVLETKALAGQIQNLIELPALTMNSFRSRMDGYDDLSDGFTSMLPGNSSSTSNLTASIDEKNNDAITQGLALNAATVANAQIAITSTDLKTRSQAIEAAQSIADSFDVKLKALETRQKDTENADIDSQYFAWSQSYADAALLTSQVVQYLITSAFDLAIEKYIVLDRPRAPIEIAITEYGALGENDYYFHLFCDSNKLTGDELLLLPRGKQVVIYA